MQTRPRRGTKIVATLGPSTDQADVLPRLIAAGVDVVRLNYSHGRPEDQARRVASVREATRALGRDVAILADLPGPKIRIERFVDGAVELTEGASFALDPAWPKTAGTAQVVGCAYDELARDLAPGDLLLLDDGAISLRVEAIRGSRVETTVLIGGRLRDRKGINKRGGGLSAGALTDLDRDYLRHAVAQEVDFIAISFPRSADDMREARELIREAGGDQALVAKIERAEALTALSQIIGASEAVMVARGDLGVEIGDAELPGWQKKIIREAREQNRMVITATQMMESMINNATPTRAEVLDVANAVMDGTDAVMLSAETASGSFPVKTVEAMARVCEGAEASEPLPERRSVNLDAHFRRTDEAIAMAATWTARHMHAQAIVALTESGATALMMSRTDTRIPIYALTQHESTRRYMALCRGVHPMPFLPTALQTLKPTQEALELLVGKRLLQPGDRVVMTKGDFTGPGGTNAMKVLKVA